MYKIGSLFDGSGGFPLAASRCGIVPTWASEVEPYPIAVTRSRFPDMEHLGDICMVNGATVEPVDVITFGSPCQDLSIAGRRSGLKHTANGDAETTRSGLFMEAVRIIKETREATNGDYPSFAIWENVPGAFSSNKGEDFRVVLEELIKIVEPEAVMPAVPARGWAYADCYVGNGWSLAYRLFDAQYWGTPQRRRRIHLVLDLRGERAFDVLFEREGLRGYFETFATSGQAVAGNPENRPGNADAYTLKIRSGCAGGGKGALIQNNLSATLATNNDQCLFQPLSIENHLADSRVKIDESGKVQTLSARMGTGGGNVPLAGVSAPNNCLTPWDYQSKRVYDTEGPWPALNSGERSGQNQQSVMLQKPFAMQGFGDYKESDIGSGLKARDYKDANDLVVECSGVDCRNGTEYPELTGTLQAKSNGGFSVNCNQIVRVRYIVRRLTPTECARLQGFPDKWGHPDPKDALSDAECEFWMAVRNTHAAINGKAVREYTNAQMLTWYNKLHTDSAEYKMWGNGIALPPALYVMQGISDALEGGKT